jgi:hypothetical protein
MHRFLIDLPFIIGSLMDVFSNRKQFSFIFLVFFFFQFKTNFVWPRGGDLAIKVLRIEFETMANIAYHLNKIIEKYGENLIKKKKLIRKILNKMSGYLKS